jgi:hypothetical protein
MTPPANRAKANTKPLTWTLIGLGALLVLFGTKVQDVTPVARWILGLGGLAIMLAAPAGARGMVNVELTEEGVTGPGFLKPICISWKDVDRVCDDRQGIIIQSRFRSTRINLSTVRIGGKIGNFGKPIGNFDNPDEMVRFVLAHIPKSSLLELHYWMPT